MLTFLYWNIRMLMICLVAFFLFEEHSCWGPCLWLWCLLIVDSYFHLFGGGPWIQLWKYTHSCNCPMRLSAQLRGPAPALPPRQSFLLATSCACKWRPWPTPSSVPQRPPLPSGNGFCSPVTYGFISFRVNIPWEGKTNAYFTWLSPSPSFTCDTSLGLWGTQ